MGTKPPLIPSATGRETEAISLGLCTHTPGPYLESPGGSPKSPRPTCHQLRTAKCLGLVFFLLLKTIQSPNKARAAERAEEREREREREREGASGSWPGCWGLGLLQDSPPAGGRAPGL
jgi:hypothetical protein